MMDPLPQAAMINPIEPNQSLLQGSLGVNYKTSKCRNYDMGKLLSFRLLQVRTSMSFRTWRLGFEITRFYLFLFYSSHMRGEPTVFTFSPRITPPSSFKTKLFKCNRCNIKLLCTSYSIYYTKFNNQTLKINRLSKNSKLPLSCGQLAISILVDL